MNTSGVKLENTDQKMELSTMLVASLSLLVAGGDLCQDSILCQKEKLSRHIHQENDFRAPDFDHSKLQVNQGNPGTLLRFVM